MQVESLKNPTHFNMTNNLNVLHASYSHIEISTEKFTCWNCSIILQLISQRSIMIEQRFDVLKILTLINDSLYSTGMNLNIGRQRCFGRLGDYYFLKHAKG